VVDCDTCHQPNLSTVTQISLASGVDHPVSGADVSCVTCHQGRAAGSRIEAAISGHPLDEVSADLRFVNPHYALAAATNLGSYGGLGYHYADKSYSGRFNHAKPVETCVSCHEPHTLEVAEATCLTCHETGDAAKIRIQRASYDGSGNTAKGIHDDIKANAAVLMGLIGSYAAEVNGARMVYDGKRYPYFFLDANADGIPDIGAEDRPVAYNAWTPRMLRTVYNWKFVTSDAGVHVHNPPYALELLYDSIEDLTVALERDMAEIGIQR
jgi:formate-dependent nitrite reductase cytochrome c552 subunit